MGSPQIPTMLTVAETAAALRCSGPHVRKLVRTGRLRAVRRLAPNNDRVTQQTRLLVFADSISAYLGIEPVKPSRREKALQARTAASMARLVLCQSSIDG